MPPRSRCGAWVRAGVWLHALGSLCGAAELSLGDIAPVIDRLRDEVDDVAAVRLALADLAALALLGSVLHDGLYMC